MCHSSQLFPKLITVINVSLLSGLQIFFTYLLCNPFCYCISLLQCGTKNGMLFFYCLVFREVVFWTSDRGEWKSMIV